MKTLIKEMTEEELIDFICEEIDNKIYQGYAYFTIEEETEEHSIIYVEVSLDGNWINNEYWISKVDRVEVAIFDKDDNEIEIDFDFKEFVEDCIDEYWKE